MDYIKENKLRGQRGASLLFAFLFLLVASMVSAVIIAGATTATRRVHDDFGREQNYLTLESAAKILRDLLKDTTVTVTVVTEIDEETGEDIVTVEPAIYNEPLREAIRNAIEELITDKDKSNVERIFVVSVSDEKWKKTFPDIQMSLMIEKIVNSEGEIISCTTNGVIQIQDERNKGNNQKLFLEPVSVEPKTISVDEQKRTTFEFNWNRLKIYTRKLSQNEDENAEADNGS